MACPPSPHRPCWRHQAGRIARHRASAARASETATMTTSARMVSFASSAAATLQCPDVRAVGRPAMTTASPRQARRRPRPLRPRHHLPRRPCRHHRRRGPRGSRRRPPFHGRAPTNHSTRAGVPTTTTAKIVGPPDAHALSIATVHGTSPRAARRRHRQAARLRRFRRLRRASHPVRRPPRQPTRHTSPSSSLRRTCCRPFPRGCGTSAA